MLNIARNRESNTPGIENEAEHFLRQLISPLAQRIPCALAKRPNLLSSIPVSAESQPFLKNSEEQSRRTSHLSR
jgi:hypothetical protein